MGNFINTLSQQEQLNFLLTNRIPRRWATQMMGWYSNINSPLLTKLSIFVWKLFADDLDLSEAKHKNFQSLRACFIRELKEGSRTIDLSKNRVISPCDGIVGACGKIENGTVFQGFKAVDIPGNNLIAAHCTPRRPGRVGLGT